MTTKKKILTLSVAALLTVTAAVGGTLAYFTDTDEETNVFTVGNIDIDLVEEFEDDALLMPGTKTQNAVNKDVWVKNVGKNDAWVRVKVSVPAHLDVLTDPSENYEDVAAGNILHWNTVAGNEAIWNVAKANNEAVPSEDGKYNVYTFYYNEKLSAGKQTAQLLDQVYLDAKVDHDGTDYTYDGKKIDLSNVDILVVAEAIQADGFDTYEAAFAAYDAQQ